MITSKWLISKCLCKRVHNSLILLVADTEDKKINCFITGLRANIQGIVAAHFPLNYATTQQIMKPIDNQALHKPKAPLGSGTSSRQKREFDHMELKHKAKSVYPR